MLEFLFDCYSIVSIIYTVVEANHPNLIERFFGGVHPQRWNVTERPPVFYIPEELRKDRLDYLGMHKFETPGVNGYIVVPKQFEDHINPTPETHGNGSAAKYIIDGFVMKNGHPLFLSTIEEGQTTSHHHHIEPLSEDYWILHGQARVGENIVEDYSHAPSRTDHQVTALEPNVLFIAQLRHAGKVPRELWHMPIE